MAEKVFQLNTNQIETYKELGFAIIDLYSEEEVINIRSFVESWIYKLLSPWIEKREDRLLLGEYHIWSETFGEGDIDYPRLAGELAKLDIVPHIVLEQAVEKGTPHTMSPVEAHRHSGQFVRNLFIGS